MENLITKRNILSIDGGGIKGVFAAKFLADLEEKCGQPLYNYFDLIAGTSTGAIIAAGLAVGIPAKDILGFYLEKGPEIFKKYPTSSSNLVTNIFHKFTRGKYDSTPLKAALEDCFGDALLGSCKTRLVIPAYNLSQSHPTVFKTPHSTEYFSDYKEKIVDILLATTAAPTYFNSHTINGRGSFIDGGIFANNPASIATIEAISKCGWKPEDIYLLSIGSTLDAPTKIKSELQLKDGFDIINLLFQAERQQNEYIPQILLLNDKSHYTRINATLPPKTCALDTATPEAISILIECAATESQNLLNEVSTAFCDTSHSDYKSCF